MSLKFSLMITSVALAAILAGAWLADVYREHDSRAMLLPDQVITLFPDPKPLTAFALTDDKNRIFDLASLKGKWSFLFFGFTYCPDVCPTTLAVLARVRDNIAKNTVGAEDLQFVFVSVDPNRDTAGKLGQYVEYFDASFLGVTGDNAQIANLAGQLGAAYEVAITPGMENYPVYHTTAVFLVDPQARYHAVFTPPHDAEAISKRFTVVRELEAAGEALTSGRGHRFFYRLLPSFPRRDADPLGHTRTGAQQLAAVLSDPVGDVAVMAHEKENKQHQHHADPKNDRNFAHRQQLTRCTRTIPSGKRHRE